MEPAADSAATVQEAEWEVVESVSAVMGSLAFGPPSGESSLLQPFAVNLINANRTSDKIPVFLIRETVGARGPGQLARRFGMIGVVSEVTFNSIILRGGFSLVDQDCVIDAETRISCEKTGE